MTFRTAAAADLTAVFFNSDEFADEIVYTPNGGAPATITAILTEEDPTIQTPAPPGDTMIVLARHADISSPGRGDAFAIDGEDWHFVEIVAGGRAEGIWHIRASRSARRDLGAGRRL